MISERCRPALLAGAAVALTILAGCSLGPDEKTAAEAARAFHAATADGDGAAACALLSPSVIEDLEQSAGAPCADAIVDEEIPEVGDVIHSEAYGRNAQVAFDGDTVFLSIFDGAWRVIAAGCTPHDGRPYDCAIKGG